MCQSDEDCPYFCVLARRRLRFGTTATGCCMSP
jgi:hypothetical protein